MYQKIKTKCHQLTTLYLVPVPVYNACAVRFIFGTHRSISKLRDGDIYGGFKTNSSKELADRVFWQLDKMFKKKEE